MRILSMLNLPNLLTLIRLILAPLILPFLLVYYLPQANLLTSLSLSGLFLLFAATDFFDGYLARKYNLVTPFGKLWDPIADKFLVTAVLISLLAVGRIYFFWVLLLICREFLLMGLRLFALETGQEITVSQWGKAKTCAQCLLLAVLIARPIPVYNGALGWDILESFLLTITLSLSLYSAYNYWQVNRANLFE